MMKLVIFESLVVHMRVVSDIWVSNAAYETSK